VVKLGRSEKNRKEVEVKLTALQEQINTSELRTVESKLNPHLFKNILNSIQSHAYQTYFALDKLANVLDYILYDSRNKFVTPKEEIDFALNLIEINKIKLSPLFEFKVKLKVDENDPLYNQKLLAPLISIDLIENAFKHADLQSPESFITITFEFRDGIFGLNVSNKISPKIPLQKERGGIGAETLEQRLRLIYKHHYQLEKVSEHEIYVAYLKINLREHKTQMRSA
jgi:LytS/YehU family sensor histidine kinase